MSWEEIPTHFVVAASVADIRRDPDAEAELVTQALMNTTAVAGDVSGQWTSVTLADYSGWIRTEELELPIIRGVCEDDEGACGLTLPYSVVVTATHTPIYLRAEADETSGEVYLSTVLPFIDLAHAQRVRVALPGERDGWLPREAIEVRQNPELFPKQSVKVATSYAKAFLGIPYLWGGTSWRGIDCSGFVQLCYRMAGELLPRDADQQHDVLGEVLPLEQLQEGDLIFFGKDRITHVALALNKHEYIHAEGQHYEQVIIHSFDPLHPSYHPLLAERIWAIKRVNGMPNVNL